MLHDALILMPVLIFALPLALAIPVIVRMLRPCKMTELTPEWVENFHVSSYGPMEGLLAADDFQFLSRQPGFDPSLHTKLRRERLLIFRQYLNRLIVDFNRLHRLALIVVARSKEDQSELFVRLFKIRACFALAVMQVELSYFCCRLGMRTMAVSGLLARLDEMSSQLALLSANDLHSVNL